MALKKLDFDTLLERLILRTGRDTDSPTVADYPDLAAILNLRLQEIWDYPGGGWDFLKSTDKVVFTVGMRVAGFGLEEVNGTHFHVGTLYGKPQYTLVDDISVEGTIGNGWQITNIDDGDAYTSDEDVATPDLVTNWTVTNGEGEAPVGTVSVSAYKKIDLSDGKTVVGVYSEDPRENPSAVALPTSTFTGDELRVHSAQDLASVWVVSIAEAPDWVADDSPPEIYQVWASAAIELAYADVLQQETALEVAAADRAKNRGYSRLDELCNRYAVMNTVARLSVRSAGRSRYF